MQTVREEITVLENLFTLLIEANIPDLNKETKELSQQINQLESQLNVAINDAETNASKNIDRFKK
jgi:predicted amino acid-binding ACT domain protein